MLCRFLYNLAMPLAFIIFLPHLIVKYRSRGGWKSTFGERFALFGARKAELANFRGAIWIHAVSVGETVVAMSMIKAYIAAHPERKFVISTTTTTGQDVARAQCPQNATVIFCPIDFSWMVRHTLNIIEPKLLVIFETELWPNLISIAKKRQIPVAVVNGRLSDHSASGYRRVKFFMDPLLKKLDIILAQSEADAERFRTISPEANVVNAGNLKFDQPLPELPPDNILSYYLGSTENQQIILAASTHPGEDELIVKIFRELKTDFADLKLVLVPRHAERGDDIAEMLKRENFDFARRSLNNPVEKNVDILLADTTGEMLKLMKDADIILMGKSFAGHDEGHNLIEPALLAKPIITGPVLRNFRYILQILTSAGAVLTATDAELPQLLPRLLADKNWQQELGQRAAETIGKNHGAVELAITELEKLYNR